ncbi:MAG TPA: histidine--tRNA ligase [Candidatus Limnocylindrales bacterium]|nr:histidine--tRNA ligase [Candidatus Limnocylindrales bacterium]
MPGYRAPVGTHDVLPPESARWAGLVARFATRAGRAGYGLVVSPMFEDVEVFGRVGETTDVVRKEMYDFEDKGGRRIALRPEGTASVVRAFVQHRPPTPFKAWYAAPSFRYERPQAGRFRQHHQLGVEVLGTDDPDVDVEVIALADGLFRELGLSRVDLHLNSLGDDRCRPAHRAALVEWFTARRDQLCDEHRDRIEENPLRILDCKRPECRAASEGAPRMVDMLCEDCAPHFARVRAGLDALGIGFTVDPMLVRGLDYYTRTTFEFAAAALESAQNGIGGGGRYDGLAEALGGDATPGIGFGLGVERILLACDAEDVFPAPDAAVDVFVIDTTGGEAAMAVTHELRAAGIAADRAFDDRSWKAQLKAAQRSGAALAVSVEQDGISIRTLQEKGEAERVDRADIVEHVRKRLAPAD